MGKRSNSLLKELSFKVQIGVTLPLVAWSLPPGHRCVVHRTAHEGRRCGAMTPCKGMEGRDCARHRKREGVPRRERKETAVLHGGGGGKVTLVPLQMCYTVTGGCARRGRAMRCAVLGLYLSPSPAFLPFAKTISRTRCSMLVMHRGGRVY